MGKARPLISLCMIVRDEEELLKQAIDSVRSVVEEIIVVDTGSTDQTPHLACSLGARVYQYKWRDDFAHARNFSLSKATGKWILVLDADEALDGQHAALLPRLTCDRSRCFLLTQRHYCRSPEIAGFKRTKGEFPVWEKDYAGYTESALIRFFPRRKDVRYQKPVHELIEYSVVDKPHFSIQHSGLIIHHYGQDSALVERRQKRRAEHGG